MNALKDIIDYCNNYIKENPFLSVIVFGILTNFLTDLVKMAFAKTITGSVILSKFVSKKLIINGIKGFKLQLEEIEEYKNNPSRKTSEYVVYLYENFILFVIISTSLYFLVNYFYNKNFLFAFYGSSANIMFKVILGTWIRADTIRNLVFDLEKYEKKTKNKIQRLETSIQEKKTDDNKQI